MEIMNSILPWVLTLCGSEKAQLFRRIYSLHFQGRRESQTTNQQKFRLILLLLASCLASYLTLKMEAKCSSETLGCLKTTWYYNLENHTLHIRTAIWTFTDVWEFRKWVKKYASLLCTKWGFICHKCPWVHTILLAIMLLGARGSVGGWDTIVQAGRSPVRVPDEVNFFNLPNLSSCTMALGSTQRLTEMSTRNLPGGKKRLARRADNLAATCEPNVWKCGSLNLSQP
jgi:hypothetical protein